MVDAAQRESAAHMASVADGVRAAIGALPADRAVMLLLDFAERYAIDMGRFDQALVLRLQSSSGDTARLREPMLTLVDAIAGEFSDLGGVGALAEREQADARTSEVLLRRAPERGLAFSGRGLSKRYPGSAGSAFVFGTLDLDLRLGEITGVVGQNAHGKTTLLRIVGGELQPDSGSLSYPALGQQGPRIDWSLVKRSIAYVPQELPSWRGSLADTLHYEAAVHGILGADNEREVHFVVQRLGLTDHLDKKWPQLSGGFKLRFALARALVWKPQLLIMDEPLANLDVKAKGVLLQDIRDMARSYRNPIAVLMSSHELHSMESVCSQMVFLSQGRVVYAGASSKVGLDHPHNEFELSSPLGAGVVRERLADSPVIEIKEDGLNLLIVTPKSFSRRDLLSLLLERDIDVQGFRDNSRSVRRLFQ